jgi:hypothetical protein
MKHFFSTLSVFAAAACLSVSCVTDEQIIAPSGPSEVELQIAAFGGGSAATRAGEATPLDTESETDPGIQAERNINTIDVLLFDADTKKYLYRKEAVKLSQDPDDYRYRLSLDSTGEFLVHVFANCNRFFNEALEAQLVGKTWEQVHALLIDDNPGLLANGELGLPMYGPIEGVQKLSADKGAPTRWPSDGRTTPLQRAVASFDVYVQLPEDDDDLNFELSDMYVAYAPNKGALGAIPLDVTKSEHAALPYGYEYTSATRYLVPAEMTTSLTHDVEGTVLHAAKKQDNILTYDGNEYEQISYGMYVYDNPYRTTSAGAGKRPTRIVVAGKYKYDAVVGTGTPTEPQIPEKWTTEKRYYPIDIVEDYGAGIYDYRPVIRNYKYEFVITEVTGPGYGTLTDAINGAPIYLNFKVSAWNKADVATGVRGRYYVSMPDRDVQLWRNAGNFKTVQLEYTIEDSYKDSPFKIKFEDSTEDFKEATIENDYFIVEMIRPSKEVEIGTVGFKVTAKEEHPGGDPRTGVVKVEFRELKFDINITQLPMAEEDWIDTPDQNWVIE